VIGEFGIKSHTAAAVDATTVRDVNQPYNATKYIARSQSQGNQTMSEVKSLEQTGISPPSNGSQDHRLQNRGLPDFRIKDMDATEEDWDLTQTATSAAGDAGLSRISISSFCT